jgi:hypothetical protein
MNLRLFGRVLSRFRLLVLAGVAFALALSALSMLRIELDDGIRFEYRTEQKWQSVSRLLVTQRGFPWGRSVLDEVVPVGPSGEAGYIPKYSEGERFQGLAQLYAALARGDEVRALVERSGPIDGEYDAAAVKSDDGITSLPLVEIGAFAPFAHQAEALAQRATNAFLTYLQRTQEQNQIPLPRRIEVEVIEEPSEAVLVKGRPLTRPIFLLVLVISATILLAFALENLRPRVSPAAAPAGPTPVPEVKRKTA